MMTCRGQGIFLLLSSLSARYLFIMKGDQVLADRLILKKKKVYSRILPLSTELLNFVLLSLFFLLGSLGNFPLL